MTADDARARFVLAMSRGPSGREVVADRLCAACRDELAVDGASLSAISDVDRWEPLASSGAAAGRLQALELDLGEGPSFAAHGTGVPVLLPDLASPAVSRRWPVWTADAVGAGAGAVFALPVAIGAIRIGVLLLHRATPGPLGDEALAGALGAAESAAIAWVDGGGERTGLLQAGESAAMGRAEVHQATGVVMAQLGVSAHDALALLRGHAFASGRRLQDVSEDVLAKRLVLPGRPSPGA